MAPCFAGNVVLADRSFTGFVHVESGRIIGHGEGEPPEPPTAGGWIIPAPVNSHTHIGDAFLRDRPGKPRHVAQLVGPGGWKHRHLASASTAEMEAGIRAAAHEMASVGTASFIDFREGGLEGVQILRGLDLPVAPFILGRPSHGGEGLDELVAAADGLGISGLRDHSRQALELWAEACHDARKPFAIHVSEDQRDDIDAALALEPAFVVHMTQGKRRDFEALAGARVPVVICPRSNAFFGMQPPVKMMVEEGVAVAIGTDNAMLHDGNVLAELAVLQETAPDLSTEAILRMAVRGRSLAGLQGVRMESGAPADLIVLPDQPLGERARRPVLGAR